MARLFTDQQPADTLCQIASQFYQRGWMAGTAGNLSLRDNSDDDCFWLTSSGKPKGQLEPTDIILMPVNGNKAIDTFASGNRPSAETSIHQTIYRHFPEARACFHVHSVEALIATEKHAKNCSAMTLPNIEMIKGFDIWQQTPDISLPVFENHQQVPDIALEISRYYENTPPQIDAFMIRHHGITVWGKDAQTTFNRVEIIEFILKYMALI